VERTTPTGDQDPGGRVEQALQFHHLDVDRAEHQVESEDRVAAAYVIVNRCDCAVLTDIVITHPVRTDVDGEVVLSCEPSTVVIPGELAPHEERQVTLEIVTQGELPGRHALRFEATYRCRPVVPTAQGLLELLVVAD
jgi:hypothetical protein